MSKNFLTTLVPQDDTLFQELPLFKRSYKKRDILWNITRIFIACTILGCAIYLSIDDTNLAYAWFPLILVSCCICGYMIICRSGIWYGLNHETLILDGRKSNKIYTKKAYFFHEIKHHIMSFKDFSHVDTGNDFEFCSKKQTQFGIFPC